MSELVRSDFEIKGIWGESISPEVVAKYSAAYGTYLTGGKIIVGRDTRTTSESLVHASIAGLVSTGCEVIDIGICPTPSSQLMTKRLKVGGG